MVYCCDGLPKHQLLPTSQKVEKWLSRIDSPGEQFKDDIERVLKDFWLIADKKELNEGFTKIQQRVAPVEFLFVGKNFDYGCCRICLTGLEKVFCYIHYAVRHWEIGQRPFISSAKLFAQNSKTFGITRWSAKLCGSTSATWL